jgi:hypothetical protein
MCSQGLLSACGGVIPDSLRGKSKAKAETSACERTALSRRRFILGKAKATSRKGAENAEERHEMDKRKRQPSYTI